MKLCKKMHHKLILVVIFGIALTASGLVIWPFQSWDHLIQKSRDILLTRCTKTPSLSITNTDGSVSDYRNGLYAVQMEAGVILKGITNYGPVIVKSQYPARQGEWYLVFGNFESGGYQAYESYRLILLGTDFPTNILAGKSLDGQIQLLLKWRLDMLDKQMQHDQEEKKRLEQGIQK